MTLSTAQLDRAIGVLLGTAAGDALGAAYEFGPPRGPELEVAMVGGGGSGWQPGEWTDDTSMAIAIAGFAATGAYLRDEEALDALARRWHEWSLHAKDVGVQTRSVLSRAGRRGISAQTARAESEGLHKLTGRTAGNGSLMRTAPVALAYLDDEYALVEAARAVSELTHWDREAGDACVLWCLSIRHAVLTGVLDARIGLQPAQRVDHRPLSHQCRPAETPERDRMTRRSCQRRPALAGGQLLVDLAELGLRVLLGRAPAATIDDPLVVLVAGLGQPGAQLLRFLDHGLHVIADGGQQSRQVGLGHSRARDHVGERDLDLELVIVRNHFHCATT